jgi:hypothetical protein
MISSKLSLIFLSILLAISILVFLYPKKTFSIIVYGLLKPPYIVVPFFRVLSGIVIVGAIYYIGTVIL